MSRGYEASLLPFQGVLLLELLGLQPVLEPHAKLQSDIYKIMIFFPLHK